MPAKGTETCQIANIRTPTHRTQLPDGSALIWCGLDVGAFTVSKINVVINAAVAHDAR